MNYTGNPRHLRTHPRRRSSQKEYFYRRQRLNTSSALTGRPQLDICQNFQEQWAPTTAASAAAILLGNQAKKTPSVSSNDAESLQVKRRRLLQQKDWLGLEISAPIKIYDIRAAKEQKRRANGPFMRPLFHQSSELTTSSPHPASQFPSPSVTSHSSTSLYPQPTVPSIHSSQHGSGFAPSSHRQSPAIANRGSSPSKSVSSSTSWNPFIKQCTPAPSDLDFIPESNAEVDFFSKTKLVDKDPPDIKNLWTLVEEQKREDQRLRTEFGWESQSGVGTSQVSLQQQCRSQDAGQVFYGERNQHGTIYEQSQLRGEHGLELRTLNRMEQENRRSVLMHEGTRLQSPRQEIPSTAQQRSHSLEHCGSSLDRSNETTGSGMSDTFKHTENENFKAVVQEQPAKGTIINTTSRIAEAEEQEEDEDEGIPWF